MARRVWMHVGVAKSGTTYLQSCLWANRDVLRGQGLLLPGRRAFEHNRAALGAAPGPHEEPPQPARAAWRRLVEQCRDWDGDAVLSHEWFARATSEQATRAVADLAPAEVHVVVTARDLVRLVPAGWQEVVKLGHGWGLTEFVERLDRAEDQWCWDNLDPALVLARWPVPADRVHVVTVPPPGSDPALLWARLTSLLGVDPALTDTSQARPNASLSAEAARWLQVVGPRLRQAVTQAGDGWMVPYRWLRREVAHDHLAHLAGSPIALDDVLAEDLRARSALTAQALGAAGYDVVGDLDDLSSAGPGTSGVEPAAVPDADLLEVAGSLTAHLLRRLQEETERADAAERRDDGDG